MNLSNTFSLSNKQNSLIGLKRFISFLSTKGTWALIDQGLFAGTNFLLNVLLARWMSPQHYGAFVIAYSIFILMSSLHTAILTEPMVIFSNRKYNDFIHGYLGMIFKMHLLVMVPFILLLCLISYLIGTFYGIEAKQAVYGITWASAAILLLWVVRRAFYATLSVHLAALSSLIYLIFILPSLYYFHIINLLNHFSVFFPIGLGALLASLSVFSLLKPSWVSKGTRTQFKTVAHEHWEYGKWAMGISLLTWTTQNIYYWVLPSVIGLEGVAELRALLNLRLPFAHASYAFSMLFIPILAKIFHNQPDIKSNKAIIISGILMLTAAMTYSAFLFTCGEYLLELLYSGKYTSLGSLIPILCFFPVCTAVVTTLTTVLMSMEKPRLIFFGNVGSCAVSICFGILLTTVMDVKGALFGYIISQLFAAGIISILFTRNYEK